MAGRTFAQINCSLTRSKKLKQLENHKHRWAYLCAHLSDFCTFSGMFRYPTIVWAGDACLTLDELDSAIEDLCHVGLIEYDQDEEIVRICSWFHKKNCPDNASRMIGYVGDYLGSEIDNLGMYLNSVSEFLVGSVARSQSWKPDSPDRGKMREALGQFSRQIYQEYQDEFLACLSRELQEASPAIRAEFTSLCPPLDLYETTQSRAQTASHPDTLSTPCRHNKTETRRDGHQEEIEKKIETKTMRDFEVEDPSQASSHLADVAVLRREEPEATKVRSIRPTASLMRSVLAQDAINHG